MLARVCAEGCGAFRASAGPRKASLRTWSACKGIWPSVANMLILASPCFCLAMTASGSVLTNWKLCLWVAVCVGMWI